MPLSSIRFFLPESTIDLENSRSPRQMETHDLLQCFAGDVEFVAEDGKTIMRDVDAPIFRFAFDLANAVNTICAGERSTSFVDFYGEFEILMERLTEEEMRVTNTATGEGFLACPATLVHALREAIDILCPDVETRIPMLIANIHYQSLRKSLTCFAAT